MGHPDPAAGAHDRLERRHHTAGWNLRVDLAVAPHVADRLTVGGDEERLTVEAHAHELLEALLRPHRLAGHAQRRLSLGSDLGAIEVAGEPRDLLSQGAEEFRVGDGGRREGLSHLERLRPLGQGRHGPHDGHAHDEKGDQREAEGQHEEPYGVELPQHELRRVEGRRVQEHRQRSHGFVVLPQRSRVHVGLPALQSPEAGGDLVPANRLRDLGDLGAHGGRIGGGRRDGAGDTVVDGDAAILPSEAVQRTNQARRGAASHDGLDRLLEALGQETGSALQVVPEPLTLLADLEKREGSQDDQCGDPDGAENSKGHSHAAIRLTCLHECLALNTLEPTSESSAISGQPAAAKPSARSSLQPVSRTPGTTGCRG